MPKRFNDVKELVNFATQESLKNWQTKLYKKHRNELQVHSKGEIFYKIDRLFPNEQLESKLHRVLAFEPITKQSFWKGVNNVIEIFQNSSYSAEASEKTVEHITKHLWDNKNLFSYFLDYWTKVALSEDPNALCVVYPFEYLKKYPDTQQIKFISSEYIRFNEGGVVIFTSIDESDKDYTLEESRIYTERFYDDKLQGMPNLREVAEKSYSERLVAKVTRETIHVFTEDGFYRLDQDKDKPQKWDWQFFACKNKFVPVISAGGLQGPTVDINESLFHVCIPMGNLALLQHSQHTAVNFTFSFPRMSELQGACDHEACNMGYVLCEKSELYPEGKRPCPKCKGSGYTSNQTPYKIYTKKYDMSGTGDNEHLKVPDVQFYTPDVAILNYSKAEWREYLEEMEKALFINQPVKTGDQPSAKSKDIDLKDKYSFLKRIAKVFYDRLRFVVQCYENYLVGSPNQVTINTPFSFAIITETEAFEVLNNILNSNAPILVKANQIEMYINKFISASSPIKKAFNVLKIVDKLLYYSMNDITVLKSNGVVTREQWITHAFAYPVLVQMYNDDIAYFTEQPLDVIAEKLKTELEPYMQESDNSLKAALKEKLSIPPPAGFEPIIKP